MKRILLSILLLSSLAGFSQLQVNAINLTTNDIVYDAITNRIYASIPSANGANGNSIGVINQNTFQLEQTTFIGSEPSVLAISDNGQYIYSGFNGSSTVRKYDIATRTAGLQFSLGSDFSTGSYYADDIEVMPGSPNTIAVARKNNGYSPRHEGVGIYDNGVMRPITTPDHTGSNKIEFTSANSLVGYNNETTEYGLRRLSVNSNGVTNVSVSESVMMGFYLDFIYHNNRVYSTNGTVVDMTFAPFSIGQFSNVSGPVGYDSYFDRVFFASFDYSGNIEFKRFNPETFLLVDNTPISQAFGSVKSVITCGNGCYAFNTTDSKVVIIKENALSSTDMNHISKLSIYPNPVIDFLHIDSTVEFKEIIVSDLNGRIISSKSILANKISLENLSSGIYLAKLVDSNGATVIRKIVKK